MKINDSKQIIKEIINGKMKCKSILIDGSWGCGKTTAIKNAISELTEEEFTKKRIVYQSLFGIRNISELTACYSKAGNIIFSVGKSIASPFAKLIPFVGEQISEGIDNSTSLFSSNGKQRKNTVFIFDDLERVDKSFSYVSLLGLFNQLLMRGCLIICVSSLNDLSKIDKEHKKDEELNLFMEKAFDRVFYVNESPDEIILDIFSEGNDYSKTVRNFLDMFNSNIRLALKSRRLLDDIFDRAESLKYDIKSKYHELLIMKSVIYSIRVIYASQINNEKNIEEKHIDKSLTNIRERVKNELDNNSQYYLPQEKEDVRNLVIAFCAIEVNNDYSLLVNLCGTEEKKDKDNVAYTSIFYLSDDDKKKAFEEFKSKTINCEYDIDRSFAEKLIDIIRYTDFDVKEDGLYDSIVKQLSEDAIKQEESEALQRLYTFIEFPSEIGSKKSLDLIESIYDESFSLFEKAKDAEFKDLIQKALENNDYSFLLDMINDVGNYKKPRYVKDSLENLLIKNAFYLPDLAKTLTYVEWSYCHEVARYVANKEQMKEQFIDVLKKQVEKNKDSKSAIERADALVKYNLKNDYRSFSEFLSSIINQ